MSNDERGKRVIKVIRGVAGFLKRGKRVIEKDEIKRILPHQGRMLLLDRVIITATEITGEFLVTREVCEGHKIGGQLLFRGVDYVEMTAQLLVIWLAQEAAQYSNLNRKLAPLRKSSFKCISPAIPGDLLRVEIPVREHSEEEDEAGNPRIETVSSKHRPERLRQQVIGLNANVWVNNEKKAVIYFIELSIIDTKKLS